MYCTFIIAESLHISLVSFSIHVKLVPTATSGPTDVDFGMMYNTSEYDFVLKVRLTL